ncbi:MAG: hypothetical protein U0V75_13300 [Ferruginibacter sp.]
MRTIITLAFLLFISGTYSQQKKRDTMQRSMNIYVVSKSEKFEFLPYTVQVRATIKSLFRHKRMRVIIAGKSSTAFSKIEKLLKKHDAVIGNLWFDSHGLYKNGFSSFSIGQDNFSYKNINDTVHTAALHRIAAFTDENTQIGIGSCYGGATFTHPGSAAVKSGPMKGDSLMMGMAQIFYGSTIYASGGWVMMKPGIFSDKFGFAGYPLGKKYRTAYWKPVWDHLGEWYSYNATENIMRTVNTVALNNVGEIKIRSRNYLSLNKAIKKQSKAIASLEP